MNSTQARQPNDLRLDWATHAACVFACKHWHYSGVVPVGPKVAIGVYEGGSFIGVVIFSRGTAPRLGDQFGVRPDQIAELSRVALRSHRAPVSRIMAIAIKMLRKQCPGLHVLVSFADPAQGHHGGIYQACGWFYCGQSMAGREFVDAVTGRRYPLRALCLPGHDWCRGEKRVRAKQAMDLKRSLLKPIKSQGKHRYVLPLTEGLRCSIRAAALPYPKRQGERSDALEVSDGRSPGTAAA